MLKLFIKLFILFVFSTEQLLSLAVFSELQSSSFQTDTNISNQPRKFSEKAVPQREVDLEGTKVTYKSPDTLEESLPCLEVDVEFTPRIAIKQDFSPPIFDSLQPFYAIILFLNVMLLMYFADAGGYQKVIAVFFPAITFFILMSCVFTVINIIRIYNSNISSKKAFFHKKVLYQTFYLIIALIQVSLLLSYFFTPNVDSTFIFSAFFTLMLAHLVIFFKFKRYNKLEQISIEPTHENEFNISLEHLFLRPTSFLMHDPEFLPLQAKSLSSKAPSYSSIHSLPPSYESIVFSKNTTPQLPSYDSIFKDLSSVDQSS
ncbi:hypothetical protein AB834_00615 [PVC group bacterium (ex Bugula neritina AB1)]|nr:hypothetical protein AB834_00615 [PVC group bacterium (ex Bugula neritina AB1)]